MSVESKNKSHAKAECLMDIKDIKNILWRAKGTTKCKFTNSKRRNISHYWAKRRRQIFYA